MAAFNTVQLVSFEQIEPLFHQLEAIKSDLEEIKKLSLGSREDDDLLTTKQAMALLKMSHINTFKKYLENNNVKSVSDYKPLRYKKSELLKSK